MPKFFYVKKTTTVKKVLFINTETAPYVSDSPLAELGKKVPESIQGGGYEIRTFMPKWGNINERRGQLHEVIRLSGMNIIIDETDHPLIIKVASIPVSRVQVYFIDNDDYFLRKGMATDENGQLYDDNGERAVFYARGVLETVKKLRWTPDIIHCQGWMSAVVPLLVKKAYRDEPCFRDAKIVSAIAPTQLEGLIGKSFHNSLIYRGVTMDTLKNYKQDFDFAELKKLSVDYSDAFIDLQPEGNAELAVIAKAQHKPLLPFCGDDIKTAYKAFYESLG